MHLSADMFRFVLPAMIASASSLSAQTAAPASPAATTVAKKRWPAEVTKVEIPCSDGVKQPAMWFTPAATEKKPLLVGLHTWSSNYASAGGDAVYAEWCIAQGWAFVHPDFRGPNRTRDALGSDRAVQDIVEAVAWAKKQTAVDAERIYLVGVSGGGHMAMQMAGRHPEIWAGVSAWAGISDIAQWNVDHRKNGRPDRYAREIEAALGHEPAKDDPEAWKRSPLSSLQAAKDVPLDICHGIHDGRNGTVPFTHALLAFNAAVPASDRLPEDGIATFYQTRRLPEGWPAAEPDATYATWKPVFRKVSGNTRVTIFEGGHEIVQQAALNWLARQRQGQPAVWEVRSFIKLDVGGGESAK